MIDLLAAPPNRFPRLAITDGPEEMRRRPDPRARGHQVWRDAQGAVFAYCSAVDGQYRMDLPELASFHFDSGGGQVTAIPHRRLPGRVLREAYHRYVLPVILPVLGTEVLHASAVLTPRGVVAFCGDSGMGKSTLAFGLSRCGYAVWADDAVGLDLSEPGVRALALPFEIRLRPASATFFGSDPRETLASTRPERQAAEAAELAPLAAVSVLKRHSRGRVVVERLPSGAAFAALLTHAHTFALDVERKRDMIERYLSLTARLPVFEIRFAPGLDRLPAILDQVGRVIDTRLTEGSR